MSLNILIFLAFISLTGVFIALVTSLIKKIFGKKLSPVFHYYIWFIFILRLAFPVAPESSFSVYNFAYANINQASNQYDFKDNGIARNNIKQNLMNERPQEQSENINRVETQNIHPTDNLSVSENIPVNINERQITIFDILFLIYLAGVLAGLAVYIYKYAKFKRRIKLLAPADKSDYRILEYIKTSMNICKDIKLYTGTESILAGIFNPVIVLAEGLSDNEKSAVLTHELLHYKNKDNPVNIIFSIIKNVYWFNPLIKYFLNKIKDDMELLCDIKSINILNYRKDEYAMMLFKSSKNNNTKKLPAGATGMSASGKQLIYRMKFISQFKKPGKIASVIAVILVTALMITGLTNPIGAFNNNNWAEKYAQFTADEGIYDYSGKDLSKNMTALEYAEVLISSFKNINLPANSRAKLAKLTPDEIMVAYSKINTPLTSTEVLTREQLAYITDYFFTILDIETEQMERETPVDEEGNALNVIHNNLTFMPSIIVKDVFENMIENIEAGRSKDKLHAYFSYKDASAPDLTEWALEELRTLYPLAETVPIYVFDPNTSAREITEILGYLNQAGLANADIIKMNFEYNIANNVTISRIYLQDGYAGEIDNSLSDNIKSLYKKTTLDKISDKAMQEYYAAQYGYTHGFDDTLYYKLDANITDEQKQEIKTLLNKYTKYEDVPELIGENEFIIDMRGGFIEYFMNIGDEAILSHEQMVNDREKVTQYYFTSERELILPENFPNFKDIAIYLLRDDLTKEEKVEIGFEKIADSGGSSISQPQFASLFAINGSSKYSDANKITNDSFKQSVEKLYSIGILTGVPGDKFDPQGLVTWGQSAKIISTIICVLVVY